MNEIQDTGASVSSGDFILEAAALEYRAGHRTLLRPVSFQLSKGQIMVITGPSGSGKTTLAELISGIKKPSAGILFLADGIQVEMVRQQDNFVAEAGLRISYYSQRYENPNQEDVPTVMEYLHKKVAGQSDGVLESLLERLEIAYLRDRKILSLSNGERKRVQLARALAKNPGLLVLDQPFTGLDPHARETLTLLLDARKREGTGLVIIADREHIPAFADRVIALEPGEKATQQRELETELSEAKPEYKNTVSGQTALVVEMRNIKVSHGGNPILNGVDWEIQDGEKWLLRGHNGAGKTTLLSLISADHPQAYANDLTLFGRKRGSGESIWDIKRKIGFVSPELHLYFLRQRGIYKASAGSEQRYNAATCLDVVLSGFKDEVGFSSSHQKLQADEAKNRLQLMKMEHLEKAVFAHCSLGEQRIVLLARALVKTPELLILDEPCQGLDPAQIVHFIQVLDRVCARRHSTLIYVTHRAEEVPACITNLLELENGRVKNRGPFSS